MTPLTQAPVPRWHAPPAFSEALGSYVHRLRLTCGTVAGIPAHASVSWWMTVRAPLGMPPGPEHLTWALEQPDGFVAVARVVVTVP